MRLFKWLCPFLYVLLLLQSVNAAGCADIKGKTERLSCIKTQNAARQNAFRSNYSAVKLSKSAQATKAMPGQQKQAAAVLATKKNMPMQQWPGEDDSGNLSLQSLAEKMSSQGVS